MLVADGLKFLWSVLVLLFDAKFVLMVVFSCPVSDCTFDGPLKRVLAHLRSSHHPNDCPAAFVEENKLVQCSDCSQWFTRLGQHSSKCAASRLSSSGRTTDVGVTPPHSSGRANMFAHLLREYVLVHVRSRVVWLELWNQDHHLVAYRTLRILVVRVGVHNCQSVRFKVVVCLQMPALVHVRFRLLWLTFRLKTKERHGCGWTLFAPMTF